MATRDDTLAQTPDLLKTILRHKAQEVVASCERTSLRELGARAESAPPVRGFLDGVRACIGAGRPAVIAELKKASPSKGVLREAFDPAALAAGYERAGAAALSVLTDRAFFQGAAADLEQARRHCSIPVLRKDFIIDAYQVYEARAIGADCVLLIAAALGDAQLVEYSGLATHLRMDVLVEVHDERELERALALDAPLIGINNRDLRSFETDLETTMRLKQRIPDDRVVVSESGIHSAEDLELLRRHGVNAFLVGEALLTAADPGQRLSALLAAGNR